MMQIRIRLFAGLRESAGQSELLLELPEAATVAQALHAAQAHMPAVALPDGLALAVNQQYVSASTPLHDGDELALIPPVSGG